MQRPMCAHKGCGVNKAIGERRAGLPALFLVLTGLAGEIPAEIEKLTDPGQIPAQAVRLEFSELVGHTIAEDIYRAIGVSFLGEGSSRPTRASVPLPGGLQFESVLRNRSSEGDSSNEALILTSRYPLRRVGFVLGNGASGFATLAELRAFTRKGELLGAVLQEGIHPIKGPFVGLETDHPLGISTVVIDYGEEPNGEQLHELYLDFLEPQVFQSCTAQVAEGELGGFLFSTTLQVLNRFDVLGLEARLFLRDRSGEPMELELDGERGSEFVFELRTRNLRQFSTAGGQEPAQVGYACVESKLPVSIHSIYETRSAESGELVAEAGIQGGEALHRHTVPVDRDSEVDLNTAFAIVNPGPEAAGLALRFDSAVSQTFVQLPVGLLAPGEHRAVFFTELFPDVDESDLPGIVRIGSHLPTVVTTLRTRDGVPYASLPAVGTER